MVGGRPIAGDTGSFRRCARVPILHVTLGVAVAVAVYAATGTVAEWTTFRAALNSIPVEVWCQVITLSLCSYAARFLRWHCFLRRLGRRVPVWRSLEIYLSGFAMTLTPGKAGEMVRSVYLRRYGVEYHESIGAFVAERLLDLFAVGVLSSLVLSANSGQQLRTFSIVGGCIGLVLLFRSRLLVLFSTWLERRAFADRGAMGVSVVRSLFSGTRVTGALALSFAAWGAQGLSLYLIVQSLGYDLGVDRAVGIYCISILAGAASFIPGGLGATETALLYSLGVVGVELHDAIASSLVSRGLTFWLALAIGIAATMRVALWARLASPGYFEK